jgi:high-affinity iron transporter
VFNSLFGWTNSATYGSVISYNIYWIFVVIMFIVLRYKETRGHYPLMKSRASTSVIKDDESQSSRPEEKAPKIEEVKEVEA